MSLDRTEWNRSVSATNRNERDLSIAKARQQSIPTPARQDQVLHVGIITAVVSGGATTYTVEKVFGPDSTRTGWTITGLLPADPGAAFSVNDYVTFFINRAGNSYIISASGGTGSGLTLVLGAHIVDGS